MPSLREAATLALEALESMNPYPASKEDQREGALTALRAALAEPVAEEHFCDTHCTWADHAPGCVRAESTCDECGKSKRDGWALYCVDCLEPVFAQRKPLTEQEIQECFHAARNAKLGASKDNSKHRLSVVEIARAIERSHGIGGTDE